MFTAEFHSLHWNNVDTDMLAAHKRVMDHFEIPMTYSNLDGVHHGLWLEHVVKQAKSDVVVILEPDCIPLNKAKFMEYINYAAARNTFIGIGQVANHIPPASHVYAGPGFYVITKSVYNKLGGISFLETPRSDVAEEICYVAESKGIHYRALMPTCFEKTSSVLWPLGSLGYYGIGTVYDNAIYHLYQSRNAQNIELFIKRCDEVINGTFTTEGFYSSTEFYMN
jgi:hypothetical protein